ncbi:MAG: zinc-binding alcohol dehydrogenase family protein [Roseiarcus sp.]
MKAWLLDRLGGTLKLVDAPIPAARPGGVTVKIEASALMSYMKAYVEGRLPIYSPPEGWFIPGGNAVGIVHEVGPEVYHLKPGQRVMVSSHVVADENVPEPARFLLGVTASTDGKALQADWRDGTLAEYAQAPKASVTALDGFEGADSIRLAVLPRFAVPYGGLIRARLAAGETLIVTGATGAYGSATVLLAIALGAARVVAAGRNASKFEALKRVAGPRVATITLSGDIKADAESLRAAAGGGAHVALDIVGNAQDPNATLAALRALRRGGRLALMGSMGVPLPIPYLDVMLNNLEIIGQFMYPRDVFRRLGELACSGLLNIDAIRTRSFPLDALPSAMEAAAEADGLECIVVKP